MSGNKQKFWTVIISLLIVSALISACGTSSGKDVTPGPTLTAATLETSTPELIATVSPIATPKPIAVASPTALPSLGPEITFPLALGNTWVFQFTRYERYEGIPIPETLTTTWAVTETVVEVKNVSSYFVAKIHREEGAEVPVGEVPPSWKGVPPRPPTSSDYWLVVSGNRMYRQEGKLDLPNLSTALLEFVFPVRLGEKWYRSDEKARLNPTYADDWMLRKVTKVGTVVVPAGEFNDCFFPEEEWAGTTFETWFCPKVGIVDEKGYHHGTPYGFRKVLIHYQLNK